MNESMDAISVSSTSPARYTEVIDTSEAEDTETSDEDQAVPKPDAKVSRKSSRFSTIRRKVPFFTSRDLFDWVCLGLPLILVPILQILFPMVVVPLPCVVSDSCAI